MDRLVPIDEAHWTGRVDSTSDTDQFRMHQVVKPVSIQQLSELASGICFLGYACDEGVRRNQGRVGAKDGPEAFRKAFSNLAAHEHGFIADLGNITCTDSHLEATQDQFASVVTHALQTKQKLIAIGGGHDIAYGHFRGIRNALGKEARIGIINFDAHLDLREVDTEPSSGTPFWQIAQEEANFSYCCVGVQSSGNTRKLFKFAEEKRVQIVHRNDLGDQRSLTQIEDFMAACTHIYLTIDLDGFDMSVCPGVSAPAANGYHYQEILPFLRMITKSAKLLSVDIAELNPAYDPSQQTGKMAAYLAFDIINNWV